MKEVINEIKEKIGGLWDEEEWLGEPQKSFQNGYNTALDNVFEILDDAFKPIEPQQDVIREGDSIYISGGKIYKMPNIEVDNQRVI